MTTSPALEVPINDKNYCQIAIDIFLGYADNNFKGKPLWESIKIGFENQTTKKHQDIINCKIWSTIKEFCILRGVWIEENNNQFEVLMKLVSALIYDIDVQNWDMDCINKVTKTFEKVSKGIVLQLQYL